MKLIQDFNTLLADTVNLNSTRFGLLESSIEAIKGAVRGLDWKPAIVGFAAQGSWAHKTIIKPLPGDPFDADLLVYVKPVAGWEAKGYVNELYAELSKLPLYKDKVRRYSHCVTIEYAGERKIDIAPCVKERVQTGVWEVCNRDTNSFERSNPLDYTNWLIDQNTICGNNNFRKVTRLIKYLRDIKTNFTCPSFLLTTLLGTQVRSTDKGSSAFADVPTALKTLFGRLDDWLQANPNKPTVRNPVLFEEIQSAAWDDTKYANFRAKINLYRGWIDDAYDEPDKEESIGKWQRVFGEDFAAREAVEKASKVSEAALAVVRANHGSAGIGDLVVLVKRLGRTALPYGFERLPHMRRPRWRVAAGGQLSVNVDSQLWSARHGQQIRSIQSLTPAQPGYWVRFNARNNLGFPFPDSYKVEWRVTNTDEAATRANALRGDYYRSDEPFVRWERLSYRGVHMVEAFLIRKADDTLAGRSAPFYVVIE
ncbi:cyclic GMP-AMP synthase DncV-like nucleotidyltransferase [Paraburkholderia sp. BL25I1N1]|uniref:SMODS domain-containing nucleotidyltransferase n=1 Tax=Paraburkholderia sp. BL25I1N1 TaxID=1938804 RepID=UPI000D084AC4|nr:nucleotidyltransferase [Paraburkholderia sp. BL25I1N1]PRY04397.1 hypothetical protein B0G73_11273 [Paraburkholderia sp. BL25I1N1]